MILSHRHMYQAILSPLRLLKLMVHQIFLLIHGNKYSKITTQVCNYDDTALAWDIQPQYLFGPKDAFMTY